MPAYYDKNKCRWIFDFDKVVKGHRIRTTKTLPAGWSRRQAEAYARNEENRLYEIATGTAEERVLIATVVALYIKHQCPTLKNGNGVTKELARIHWAYDGRYLDELSDVAREYAANAFRETRDEQGNKITVPLSPASIKNKLSYLRAACRYAQKHFKIAENQKIVVALPTVRNERHEYASRADMLKIARACPHRPTRALIRIAFYSGMRLGEMMGLNQAGGKSRILDGVFFLHNTKNGRDRAVPIHPRIRVLLKYFPLSYKKRWIQRQFEWARDAAGFPALHFHDLRHSAASAMINSGVDMDTIGGILGHRDLRSTQRYSHLNTATLAAAIGKIR